MSGFQNLRPFISGYNVLENLPSLKQQAYHPSESDCCSDEIGLKPFTENLR
jgi:hypothetical protein